MIYSDYKLEHLKRRHSNNFLVKFLSTDEDPHQQKLCFVPTAATAAQSLASPSSSTSRLTANVLTNVDDTITLEESEESVLVECVYCKS